MSKKHRGELQFGSDSFLDVVCNIVGILIIMMVMAGVRAGRAPVTLEMLVPESLDSAPPRRIAVDEAAALPVAPPPVIVEEPLALPETPPKPVEPEAPLAPPPEFVQAVVALSREVHALSGDLSTVVRQVTTTHETLATLEQRLATVRELLKNKQSEVTDLEEKRAASTHAVATLRKTLGQLQEELTATEIDAGRAGKRIEHRITPIARVVSGEERHYRVSNNRVSSVPLQPLVERLKEQLERRKDWLAKSRQHHGQVGPIDGYALHYIMQRESLSAVDELRFGSGMYRISVAEWRVEAQPDLVEETATQALQPGGRFYASLIDAPPETTITFWVYPDSFEGYGKLKQFCHEQNFTVAGRPLPDGQPIAGSPNGSRSAGQ